MANKLSILIVDGTPLHAIALRRILIQEGYNVITARDGVEALDILKQQPFDLVISDINMPNMNGYELCHAMKTNPQFQSIPIILSSNQITPQVLIHSIEVGANSYIPRPYFPNTIKLLVNYLINIPPSFPLLFEKSEIGVSGEKYLISTDYQYVINFLLSTCLSVEQQQVEYTQTKNEVLEAYQLLESAKKEEEQLFLNIFPATIAQELIAYGTVSPLKYNESSIMFMDFVGFTKSASILTPQVLLEILSFYFDNFDLIIAKYHLERIKTVGQGYLCAGGVPKENKNHAIDCANAALAIQQFLQSTFQEIEQKYKTSWQIRIGISTGSVVAGVAGKKRFVYDIWGNTVHMARLLTHHCEPGKINISSETYKNIKDLFLIESRGLIPVINFEGKEVEEMYYLISEETDVRNL